VPELPTLVELQGRVSQSIAYHGGSLPKDTALVWGGYFAALLEWDLISVSGHEVLTKMLPPIEGDPVVRVFLGWESNTGTEFDETD
jgi:hypothetical protein